MYLGCFSVVFRLNLLFLGSGVPRGEEGPKRTTNTVLTTNSLEDSQKNVEKIQKRIFSVLVLSVS